MFDPKLIKAFIEQGLDCELVHVDGDGHHFEALIVSADFAGLSRVKQHQLVYKTLGDKMGGEIHALSMKTYTPEQWADAKSKRGL